MIFINDTILGNMFHKPKHILIILASESEKFLAFCYRVGKYIQQEDSDIFNIRPLLLTQQRRSNTSITHNYLTQGSFCCRHKMLLNNPHLNIEDYPMSSTWLGHMGWNPAYWINCSIKVSKVASKAHVSLLHLAAQKRGRRASKGMTGLFASLLTARWREDLVSPSCVLFSQK